MAGTNTSSTNTGTNQLGAITGLLDLYTKLKGSKGTTQTTTTSVDQNAVNAALQSILTGSNGVATVASGAKNAGLYSSSTNKLLMQDLLSTAAAKAGGTGTTQTVTTSGTGGTGGKELAGLMLLGQFANSNLGKKLTSSAADSAGNWIDSGYSALTNLIGSSGSAGDSLSGISSGVTDAAGSALTSVGSAAGSVASGIGDWLSGLFGGAATGGRVSSLYGGKSGSIDAESLVKLLNSYSMASTQSTSGSGGSGSINAGEDSNTIDGNPGSVPGPYGVGAQVVSALHDAGMSYEDAAAAVSGGGKAAANAALGMLGGFGGVLASQFATGPNSAIGWGAVGGKAQGWGLNALFDALGWTKSELDNDARGLDTGKALAARDNLGMQDFGKSRGNNLDQALIDELNLGQNPDISPEQLFGAIQGRTEALNVVGALVNGEGYGTGGYGDFGSDGSGWDDNTGSITSSTSSSNNQGEGWTGSSVAGNSGSSVTSTSNETGPTDTSATDSISDNGAARGGRVPRRGAAQGGRVSGDSNYGVDDVMASLNGRPFMLDGGEQVIKTKSVQMLDQLFGPGFLDALNKISDGA